MVDEINWSVVVPIKDLALAKSRLPLPDDVRRALALAMSLDTLRAVAAVANSVLVVTDDRSYAAILAELADLAGRLTLVADPGTGLNEAIMAGFAGTTGSARAALVGDLPALSPAALAEALAQVRPGSVRHVPDHDGTGTTLLAALGAGPIPSFGPNSAAAHTATGSSPIEGAAPGLRRDIDSIDDLVAAARIGVGPATSRWLGVVLAGATRPEPAHVQATLRSIGPAGPTSPGTDTREFVDATAFLADGTVIEVSVDPRWRPGQRLTIGAGGARLAGNDFGPTP